MYTRVVDILCVGFRLQTVLFGISTFASDTYWSATENVTGLIGHDVVDQTLMFEWEIVPFYPDRIALDYLRL